MHEFYESLVQTVVPKLTRVLLVPLNKSTQLQVIRGLGLLLHLAPQLIFGYVMKTWKCALVSMALFYCTLYWWKWMFQSNYWTTTICRMGNV